MSACKEVKVGQMREGHGDRAVVESACAQRGWFYVRWPKGHLSRMGRREILHRLPVLVKDAPATAAESTESAAVQAVRLAADAGLPVRFVPRSPSSPLARVREALEGLLAYASQWESWNSGKPAAIQAGEEARAALAPLERALPDLMHAYHRDAGHAQFVQGSPARWSECRLCRDMLEECT